MPNHAMDNCGQMPRAQAIALLNDRLRHFGRGGQICITRGVMQLEAFDARQLNAALAAYKAFDADNDPHGERDFGDLKLFDADLLWKIDYYDWELTYGSPDPADATVTKRVLTVMLSNEW